LARDINLQIKEAEQPPSRIYPKESTSSHIIIKLLKTKDKEKKILKGTRKNGEYNKLSFSC
jgi:hypothetical protein